MLRQIIYEAIRTFRFFCSIALKQLQNWTKYRLQMQKKKCTETSVVNLSQIFMTDNCIQVFPVWHSVLFIAML